jgi:ferredoxin-NADP reductase
MWALADGARLSISDPDNHFELFHGRPDYVLVAGGIGITPIYSMAMALYAKGVRFKLLYAARSADDLAFADEMRKLPGVTFESFVADQGQRLDLAEAISRLADGGELYVCGPIGMLEEARSEWGKSGRPLDCLRFETFGSSGRFPSAPFTVHLPMMDKSVEVARNQTILEALEAAGIEAMFDCRRGECGLCALDILDVQGIVDHRDVFFSEAEKVQNHKLCACVSRMAQGSISLDTGERLA